MKRPWLSPYPWKIVVEVNRRLCSPQNQPHGLSDESAAARALWEGDENREITLFDAIQLCRQCHRLAPFLRFNGNTFVAIARDLIGTLDLPEEETFVIRSLAGHIIAGTATDEEIAQFKNVIQKYHFAKTIGE